MKALRQFWLKVRCLPIKQFREIEGWLTDREALGLYTMARGLSSAARIVEIGSWKGKSTFCLAKGLQDGQIIAIDPFDAAGEAGSRELYDQTKGGTPLLDQFKQNLGQHGLLDKIEIRKGYSNDFEGTIHDVDFLFIDGDHSKEGCERDFRMFSPEVRAGGIVAFHDYDSKRPELGPTWVVENVVKKLPGWTPLGRWDSLIAFRKS